ncbi:MAG: hypothetical protein ACLQG5_06910 [Methanobacterium sp.]|jgi:hypothetical protein
MVAISQNLLYIIIAVIVIIGLIIVFMLRRTRGGNEMISNPKYLAKETEQKKINIVERDLESQYISDVVLSNGQQKKLDNIRENTSDLTHKIGYFNNKVNEKLDSLEEDKEYVKIQKLLTNLDKTSQKLGKKISKKKGDK